MQRRLIVTADDVGLHHGMTDGAIRAHRDGIVTACSIVANGTAFEDAVTRLRDVPDLEVGVHLALAGERTLTTIRAPSSYRSFVPLFFAGAITIAAIEHELRAQIERVISTGLRITHLNGHQHLHLLPSIFRLVSRLAHEYGIAYIRIVDDHGGSSRALSMRLLSALGRRARGSLTNDRTIGVGGAGHLTDIVPLLEHVESLTELVTHPGIGVQGYDWKYDWESETAALCNPRLRDELHARGIELTTPSRVRPI